MSVEGYNISGHRAIFRPSYWFAPELAVKACNTYPELSITRMYIAAGSLSLMQRLGSLAATPAHIFEFGSGLGEGLVTLDMYARAHGVNSVTGSEIKPDERSIARSVADTLGSVDQVAEDGIAHLENGLTSRYELIMANMFGPATKSERLIASFTAAGLPALADKGIMVINSDEETMDTVRAYLSREADFPFQVIESTEPQVPPAFHMIPTPHVVIQKPAA